MILHSVANGYVMFKVLPTNLRENCSENWDENHHLPQCKCQHICSTCKIYFFDQKKNMAALPEWAYIANCYISSSQQSRKTGEWRYTYKLGQGEKDIKRTNVGQWRQVFCFAFVTVFCFGQELIRGETKFSLKRQGEENYGIRKGSFG